MSLPSDPTPFPVTPPARRRLGRHLLAGASVLLLVGAINEWMGWPWLVRPAEQWLSQRLAHPVSLTQGQPRDAQLKLLGTISLKINDLTVGPPAWVGSSPVLYARDVAVTVRWPDLLTWRPPQPFPLASVSATQLSVELSREADGRANWTLAPQMGPAAAAASDPSGPAAWPVRVERFAMGAADLHWSDKPLALDLHATAKTWDPQPAADHAGTEHMRTQALDRLGLDVQLSGRYRGNPLSGQIRTGAMSDWWSQAQGLPVQLAVDARGSGARYDGHLLSRLDGLVLAGQYEIRGPSLAQAGRPLGLTLPATGAFKIQGRLARRGDTWSTVVDHAEIGQSRLAGEFQFRAPPGHVPDLSGRLRGAVLRLQDLGPAIGASGTHGAPATADGKVLPQRQFDLPSLRAMDASVLVDVARLDFGSVALQGAAPVRGHLQLHQGVLTLSDLDIGLAQGRLSGQLRLDGQGEVARWQMQLALRQARLEQWVRALQRPGATPYASGLISARLQLDGQGRSTAEWLGSADGQMRLRWSDGHLSHLAVEAAGLDLAQGLGVWLRGDDALEVQCGVVHLQVRDGVVRPQLAVIDTPDSRLSLGGQLSLADERLDLALQTAPKDISPFAARTPLRLTGTLGRPQVSVARGPLAARAAAAVALGLINPAAALLAFVDLGQEPVPTTCKALETGR